MVLQLIRIEEVRLHGEAFQCQSVVQRLCCRVVEREGMRMWKGSSLRRAHVMWSGPIIPKMRWALAGLLLMRWAAAGPRRTMQLRLAQRLWHPSVTRTMAVTSWSLQMLCYASCQCPQHSFSRHQGMRTRAHSLRHICMDIALSACGRCPRC